MYHSVSLYHHDLRMKLLYYNALQCIMQAYIMPPIHVTDPDPIFTSPDCSTSTGGAATSSVTGTSAGGASARGVLELPRISLTVPGYLPLMSCFSFCMSSAYHVSVSPFIIIYFMHSQMCKAPSLCSNFVEPGHARILAWLSFLLACHITQVPCSGTTNSADLEVIKHRVHQG